jgi:Uma2 family endonuclease
MAAAERPARRWSVAEYHRLGELGVFGPDERLELIVGEILPMSPIKSPHAAATTVVHLALLPVFGAGWVVRTQLPLTLGEDSEPQPDVAVVSGDPSDYWDAHPKSAALIVEVSDATLRFDQTEKATLYARAGIPEYWVLNLPQRRLEVRRDPDLPTGQYRSVSSRGDGETVSPLAAPGTTIAVSDLLPPRTAAKQQT